MSQISSFLLSILLFMFIIQKTPQFITFVTRSYQNYLEPKTKIGVIRLQEAIQDCSIKIRELKTFFKDPQIKAIIIKMDCPGGAAGASQALYHAIIDLKQQHTKPIITWIQNIGASGGYYVAAATDYIIATPSSFVGSIGAYIPQPHLKKFIEQFNVTYTTTKAGAYKTAGNPLLETTDEQNKMFKNLVDSTYEQFIQDIAEQRPLLSLDKEKLWADGKIFTGVQALKLGLIDAVGSVTKVEQYLKEKLEVHNELVWIKPPCKSPLLKLLGQDECDNNDEEHTFLADALIQLQSLYAKWSGSLNASDPQTSLHPIVHCLHESAVHY